MLRTPTTSIKGFFELLQTHKENITVEKREFIFNIIERNLNKLEHLIDDVSDISKSERGIEIKLRKENINLYDYLDREIAVYNNLLEGQFSSIIDEQFKEINIDIDRDRISQVLANIINNARKNTPEDGRMIILTGIKNNADYVSINIADNGAGIEEKNLEQLFTQFISIPTKYSVVGSGIGLFLSKMIIEKHYGTITAFSEGLDKGATFTIKLPI